MKWVKLFLWFAFMYALTILAFIFPWIVQGYVATIYWDWFLGARVGLPEIAMLQGIGIVIFIQSVHELSKFFEDVEERKTKKEAEKKAKRVEEEPFVEESSPRVRLYEQLSSNLNKVLALTVDNITMALSKALYALLTLVPGGLVYLLMVWLD